MNDLIRDQEVMRLGALLDGYKTREGHYLPPLVEDKSVRGGYRLASSVEWAMELVAPLHIRHDGHICNPDSPCEERP